MTYRRVGGPFIDNRPVIRALAILRQKYKIDARFVIIGEPFGPYYDQVRIEAKRCGVAPYVKVRPPFPYSDLAKVISEYEFIVSAATHDGTSNALLETMWLGGIPLNSDLRPIREWITDGVNGYLFDINDPEQIAAKFAQAVAERPKHDEFRRINRRIIKERADNKTCMSRVEEIYRELIDRS
jgi:glycosyltransferase involved in cell wall biosynthesis